MQLSKNVEGRNHHPEMTSVASILGGVTFPNERVVWSRPTEFGAWVRFGDSLLLGVDHGLAEQLGVPSGLALSITNGPLEVHIAITSRCYAPCVGCYLDARPDGEDVPLHVLHERIEMAAKQGASTVAFGGGEPLLHPDLASLAAFARRKNLVPVVTTSGAGLTKTSALLLRDFAQVNVSYDGAGQAYEAVRGYDGRAQAERALVALADAGIAVGINFVVARGSVDNLFQTAERVKELGATEMQLLRYKPVGRAASATYDDMRLTPEQVETLWKVIGGVVQRGGLRVRIDCAMVPLISPALKTVGVDKVLSLGVFGCEASRRLGAITAQGDVAPCSFLKGQSAVNVYHETLPKPCSECSLAPVCRGGCQAVSMFRHGQFSPDPECPHVIAFEREESLANVPARGARIGAGELRPDGPPLLPISQLTRFGGAAHPNAVPSNVGAVHPNAVPSNVGAAHPNAVPSVGPAKPPGVVPPQ